MVKGSDRWKISSTCICMGSVMEVEGGSWKAVKQKVKVAWMKWRDMSGVIGDKKIPRKLKCKMYWTVIFYYELYGINSVVNVFNRKLIYIFV